MVFLKKLGFALIAAALMFFLLFSYFPQTRAPYLIVYSYAVLGLGVASLIANKIVQSIQYSRLSNVPVRCRRCGWAGMGRDWRRSQCCPECDSEQVVITVH